MSMTTSIRQRRGSHLLARIVRNLRQERDLTIERAAELAGMTAGEWRAIEAGKSIPMDFNVGRAIAETIGINHPGYTLLALLSRGAAAEEQRG